MDDIRYVNFINILQADFTHADPKSAKKGSQVVSLFLALLGSMRTKAARRMLMKSTPDMSLSSTFYEQIFLPDDFLQIFLAHDVEQKIVAFVEVVAQRFLN